ncbi:hypothetical protein RR45_GL000283 [Lactococcus chungangensis CAU 28 = DSM 22330]|uniref:Integrase catalytic domain-containing protein n=1 Tax=Pseudolactococcus chungangensis CAU 28 = DSM 22330 TaxID=1122154 RepID=A0ABX4I6S4_9LACT|nr:IS3 family transposase [Lactococcus chungangensis]PCS03261.1 hypothetical protein RR45_GL000283 [Lactococcus chungangensis CAU 28 = DSM 22330]
MELFVPENETELIQQIDNFIAWYNFDRPQLKFKGMTPIEYRETYL